MSNSTYSQQFDQELHELYWIIYHHPIILFSEFYF